MKGLEVADFIIRGALLPAAKEDADPFVSQGADNDPVSSVGRLMHLVKAGPLVMADGLVSVFDEALVKEERPGVAAMDRGGLTAAFEHRSDAAEVEHCFCVFKKFAPRAESSQEPSAVGGAAARQSGKESVIGVLGEGVGDLAIVAVDGSVDGAQSQDERLHGNDGAFNQSAVLSKSCCLGDKCETPLDHIAAAGIVRVVKTPHGL